MTRSIIRQLFTLLSFLLLGVLIGFIFKLDLAIATLASLAIWAVLNILFIAKLVAWSDRGFNSEEPTSLFEFQKLSTAFKHYRDQTEAEFDEIHEDIDQFQAATAAMEDAIVIINKDGTIEWWNNSAEESLELTIEQKHKTIPEIFSDPDFLHFYENSDEKGSFKSESGTHQRILEFRVHPFGAGDRVLVARDITENEKFEQMRHTFLANASHELRTPITVIHGYLETLHDQDLAQPVKRAIRSMQSQSNRMVALISDLLTLSRLETSAENRSRQPIHVHQMLKSIADEAREVSGDNQHQISLLMDEGFDILGNEGELRSALSNLVFNAVRYTPAQGSIDIKLETVDKGVLFSVTDSGVGIAAEHIPRITERFYRVDEGRSRDNGGTGLGLAIVKHVLVRHNSKLGVSSKVGEGSRFSCIFPAERVTQNSNPSEA